MALWNCQSAVNKADFISSFSLQSTLNILGLTETWIRPEDSATPAALSNNFSFSHTPRVVNLVLLKCRKLRREDQETSDWIVSRILY